MEANLDMELNLTVFEDMTRSRIVALPTLSLGLIGNLASTLIWLGLGQARFLVLLSLFNTLSVACALVDAFLLVFGPKGCAQLAFTFLKFLFHWWSCLTTVALSIKGCLTLRFLQSCPAQTKPVEQKLGVRWVALGLVTAMVVTGLSFLESAVYYLIEPQCQWSGWGIPKMRAHLSKLLAGIGVTALLAILIPLLIGFVRFTERQQGSPQSPSHKQLTWMSLWMSSFSLLSFLVFFCARCVDMALQPSVYSPNLSHNLSLAGDIFMDLSLSLTFIVYTLFSTRFRQAVTPRWMSRVGSYFPQKKTRRSPREHGLQLNSIIETGPAKEIKEETSRDVNGVEKDIVLNEDGIEEASTECKTSLNLKPVEHELSVAENEQKEDGNERKKSLDHRDDLDEIVLEEAEQEGKIEDNKTSRNAKSVEREFGLDENEQKQGNASRKDITVIERDFLLGEDEQKDTNREGTTSNDPKVVEKDLSLSKEEHSSNVEMVSEDEEEHSGNGEQQSVSNAKPTRAIFHLGTGIKQQLPCDETVISEKGNEPTNSSSNNDIPQFENPNDPIFSRSDDDVKHHENGNETNKTTSQASCASSNSKQDLSVSNPATDLGDQCGLPEATGLQTGSDERSASFHIKEGLASEKKKK